MQIIDVLQPRLANLVFHQDATRLTVILGDASSPVPAAPDKITFRYSIGTSSYSINSVDNPSSFIITPGSPTVNETTVTVIIPAAHLALTNERSKATYVLTYRGSADPEDINALAGMMWRKKWA